MIVIADTSPLNYLGKIGHGDVLRQLYGTVIVPPAVRRELNHPNTPVEVRKWLAPWPAWLLVPQTPLIVRPELLALGRGESEAIALALQTAHSQVVIDDGDGRRMAESLKVRIIGTLGVLRDAARENLLDLRMTVQQARAAGLFVSDRVITEVLG